MGKRILVIAHYPIVEPQHGGQKRTKALVDFYSTFAEARFIGVFHRVQYPKYADTDMPLGSPEIIEQVEKNPYASELIVGRAIDTDIHVRSAMAEILRTFQPDIIHCEQVYLYAGLRVLLRELGLSPKLVFGSQNVEYVMKREIFDKTDMPVSQKEAIIAETKTLEYQFSQEANLVIAVSKDDAEAHKKMGARRTVVAPNGIEKSHASAEAIARWKDFLKSNKVTHAMTFVGSGHPPNWTGFEKMIGTDSSFLPEGAKILLAGGIADYFSAEYRKQDHPKFWGKILPLGKLSEDDLSAVLAVSDTILLPITSGGGSNLKTAEALLARKKIVATSFAFRGYDDYVSLPNISVTDSPQEYRDLLKKAVKEPYVPYSGDQERLIDHVQWNYCLRPIKKPISRLFIEKQIQQKMNFPKKIIKMVLRRVSKKFKEW